MTDYQGKVVAITGAANGIGRQLAKTAAAKGMKLALADIDAPNLALLEKELQAQGTEVITSAFDVRMLEDMEAFANKTLTKYGAVDYFFNNAGVAIRGNILSMSMNDWEWGFDINVMGLVRGIKAFVPRMIEQDKECRIINTASVAGLLITTDSPVYVTSKHAAIALTEVLNTELQTRASKVKASVYCPGYIVTDLHNSERHRPPELANDPDDPYYKSEDYLTKAQGLIDAVTGGIPVEDAIEMVWKALEEDKFYILTHPQYKPFVEYLQQNVLNAM